MPSRSWQQPQIEVTYAAEAAEPIHIGATFFRQLLPERLQAIAPPDNAQGGLKTCRVKRLPNDPTSSCPPSWIGWHGQHQIEAIATLQRYAAMRRRGYNLERIADGWRETCGIAFMARHIPQAERPAKIAAATCPRLQGEQHCLKRRPKKCHF